MMNQFTKMDIKLIRHPKERRIYIFAIIINIFAIMVVSTLVFEDIKLFYEQVNTIAEEQGATVFEMDAEEIKELFIEAWYDPRNQANIEIYTTVLALYLLTVAVLEFYYAYIRTSAVKVTKKQFSDIYEMAERYTYILGLKKMPEIYLVQQNGILNAFASNIIRKKYITINADLLEIGYRQYNDLESIGFILGHEMSHIKLRHVSIWIRYTVMLAEVLPIAGSMLSRVREYSCDRLAQAVSQNDGVEAMLALTMGKHLYKRTDAEEYLESAKNVKGFWVWVVNLFSSHPILPKRVKALVNPYIPGKIF